MIPLIPARALSTRALPLILLLSGIGNAQPQSTQNLSIRVHGEVHRAEKFEKEIGRGLVFRLAPSEFGWDIEVGPKDSTNNYMDCMNQPLHGITPYQIEGWLFRNDDNTAPRKPSDLLTPGIGEKREFQFVLNATDETKSCADLEKMEYTCNEKDPEHIAATKRFGTYAGGDGSVTITSMTLGNLKPGQQAWIESMQFEATFSFRTPSEENRNR
jgi:hypothetical protein